MKRVGQALEMRMLVDKLFDADEDALIVVYGDLNADLDEVPVEATRGDVENTGNDMLAKRVIVPCERTIPEPSRFSSAIAIPCFASRFEIFSLRRVIPK
jgi:hypothetical protein